MIRFLNDETKKKALNTNHLLFDQRPIFLQQWCDGMELEPGTIKKVPVWVQLHALPIKYWGSACLEKIMGLIGTPIKPDDATKLRSRLSFARYLVEVEIDGNLPEFIGFQTEQGVLFRQAVHYEWKPVKCSMCGGYGHKSDICPNQKKQMKWQPKTGMDAVSERAKETVFEVTTAQETPVVSSPAVNTVGTETQMRAPQPVLSSKDPVIQSGIKTPLSPIQRKSTEFSPVPVLSFGHVDQSGSGMIGRGGGGCSNG